MKRNRRLFIIVTLSFIFIVIMITVDMARRTTAPWNRRKQAERAFPGETQSRVDGTAIDTTGLDTLR